MSRERQVNDFFNPAFADGKVTPDGLALIEEYEARTPCLSAASLRVTGPITVTTVPIYQVKPYGIDLILTGSGALEFARHFPENSHCFELLARRGPQLAPGQRYAFRRKTWWERWPG